MNNSDKSILLSKFNRYKVSLTIEGEKISIGLAKPDNTMMLIGITIPLVLGFGTLLFLFVKPEILFMNPGLVLSICIGLISIGGYNMYLRKKHQDAHKGIKTITPSGIIFEEQNKKFQLDCHSIQRIHFKVKENIASPEMDGSSSYTGVLLVKVTNGDDHVLMEFQEKKESHATTELLWISNVFNKYLGLQV